MASILSRNKNLHLPKKTQSDYAEDALYREVWEDVNNEKTSAFLKRYARPLIIGAIIIVALVVGFELWRGHVKSSQITTAQHYETAITNMDKNALATLGNNESGATADLALFQSYMMDGDVTKLEKLANDGATRDYRDLAKIHLAGIQGDKMTAVEFEKFLSSLDTKSSPFYYTSALMVAQKYLATGDKKNGNNWLDKIINDKNAPSIISATAQSLR